ncbi:hypothetical protein C8Q76DRAFT_468361 [Earliella scabrosa]|nr:hypothetical protein C8Q76DRAFT_468361 [Earliella scabrosa]
MENGHATLAESVSVENEMLLLERMRVQEALNARDVAVSRLEEACVSVREKTIALDALRDEKAQLEQKLASMKENVPDNSRREVAESGVNTNSLSPFRKSTTVLKPIDEQFASMTMSDRGGVWNEEVDSDIEKFKQSIDSPAGRLVNITHSPNAATNVLRDLSNTYTFANVPPPTLSPFSPYAVPHIDTPESPWAALEIEHQVALPSISTAEKIDARYAILASLPLPSDIPDDSLTPILVPPPYTLHDFIGTTSGLLRTQLGNYRVFQQSTTTWCPEREEHGYYLTPVFLCSTNPRVSTAHRWSAVDIAAKLDVPTGECALYLRPRRKRISSTECFYNKDGKWYYAGVYKSFRLEDLCTQEWECLSTETSQALVKESLAARKNTSPQNIYETNQLYSAGALKVACIGLQCIGFNNTLYRSLLEHAALCTQTGKWRTPTGGFSGGLCLSPTTTNGPGPGPGPTTTWPPNATVTGPGSPVVPMAGIQQQQHQQQAGGVGVIGRPTGPGLVRHPSPTVLVLQRGPQDHSSMSGIGSPGTT